VSAAALRRKKTGKISDSRLWRVNGKPLMESQPLSRIQATSGIVTYVNGIQGVKKYGMKAYMGTMEGSGDALKFFAPLTDSIAN